jgi:membrane protease YdiL (CAAX protease family)
MTSFPSPQERPRAWPLLFFGLFAIFAVTAGALAGFGFHPITNGASPMSAANLPTLVVASEVALASFALVAALVSRDRIVDRLRLRGSRLPLVQTALLVLVGGALGQLVLAVFVAARVHVSGVMVEMGNAVQQSRESGGVAAVAVIMTPFPPIAEELFFRGFLQTRLTQRFGRLTGIAVASFAFAVFHFDLHQGLVALTLGLWLGVLLELTGSIVVVIAAHALNNAIGLVMPLSNVTGVAFYVAGAALLVVAVVGAIAMRRAFVRTPPEAVPALPEGVGAGWAIARWMILIAYMFVMLILAGWGAYRSADAWIPKPAQPATSIEPLVAAAERDGATFDDLKALDDALAREGRHDEIVTHWTRYIDAHPDDARALFERGGALSHLRRMNEAVDDCEAACRLGLASACEVAKRLAQRR